jgi:CRP-like cAMP-binding protein
MAVMRNAPFLRVLGEDALKLLAFGSEAQNLKPRQTLFEAGEPAQGAVLVLGGQLRLIGAEHGGPARVAGVGQLVDELALVIPTTRNASAVAQTSCEVLDLPRTQMVRILDEYPEAAERLRTLVARRAAALIDDVNAVADRFPRS